MDEHPRSHINYVSLLRRIATHWRLILMIFVGISIPVTVWALFLVPKTYEATATIFIEDPRRGGPGLLRDWIPPSDASFQIAILRSRSLAEAVAESLSRQASDELLRRALKRDYFLEAQNLVRRLFGQQLIVYSPQQRVLLELQTARTLFTPMPSGEVEIRTTAYDPRVAMELANAYVEVLQTRSRSYVREEARATREFIENFLNQTKSSLQESEEALTKAQHGRSAIALPQRSGLQLARLAQLENTLADMQATKEIAKARLSFLRGGKDSTGKALPSVARLAAQQQRDRLSQLEERLAGLLEKYTEEHPLVRATQAEIKEAQNSLAATLQSLQDPRPTTPSKLGAAERSALAKQMTDLDVEISTLEAREEVLTRQIARLSSSLSSLTTEESEALKLVRKVDTQRNLHTALTERLGTARIQEQAEGRGLRVIDLASLPLTPSSSPITKRILMGIALALATGVGVAALIEYFNQPVETEDDVARLTGLPSLGWIPLVPLGLKNNDRGREPLSLIEPASRQALPAEGCRTIRTSLESLSRHRPLQTIMFASAGPREGKSTVLLNLGWVLWEVGRRLVVVDTDLRRPALHRALPRSATQSGVADLLTGKAEWEQVQQPIKDDFLFLPAGHHKIDNPGALLNAEKVQRLLDLVKDRADIVLFDSAPILAVSDNLMLASMVDGVILVVRAGHTQRRDVLRAKEQLDKVGAQLLGVVINQVPPRDTRRYYARYSDYYGPDEILVRPRNRLNPRSWWAGRRKGNGRKGGSK